MSSIAVEAINRIRRVNTIVQKTGERVIWNASPVPVMFTHSAIQYTVPPNGPGKLTGDTEVKEYSGELLVYDVYGVDPKQAQAVRKAMKEARKAGAPADSVLSGFAKRVVISSLDVIEHAVKKLAARGVVALTGDPREDAELKAAARDAWTEFRRDECDKILARYDARKAVFYAQPRNADQPPPPMTPRETEAFVWLADYRLGLANDSSKIVCPISQCGFMHESREVIEKHLKAYHPTRAHEYEFADSDEAATAEPAPEAPKKKLGRPPKNKS